MGRSIHHPVGLIHNSPSSTFNGYTLFSTNGGDHATLIDNYGRIVHRWNYSGGIVYAYLLPNGNLLANGDGSETKACAIARIVRMSS